MFQKKLFPFILLIVLSYLSGRIEAQILQKTANFESPDIIISTTPENPAFCNGNIGVEVTVNEEFDSYRWTAPLSQTVLFGKTVVLNYSGEWSLRIEYMVNNVSCFEERKLYVGDLSNSVGIQEYFDHAGFYTVNIFRAEPTVLPECIPDPVSFAAGQSFISLEPVIQSVFDNFKPIAAITPSVMVLSENVCLCSAGIANHENQFNAGQIAIWAHHYFENGTDLTGKLFIKGRMPGEIALPIPEQKQHMTIIHSDILTVNVSTEEHGRVVFSNLFMPHPIGGYEPEDLCELTEDPDLDSYFLSPAGVPIQIYSGSSDFIFTSEDNEEGIFEGALIKFNFSSKYYQAYWKKENTFSGYFYDITGEIVEDFGIPDNSNGDLTYIIPEVECNMCYPVLGFTDKNVGQRNSQGDGGISSPMLGFFGTNESDSKELIYNLLCAIRHGETSFDFGTQLFSNKVIIAKDVYLGNILYDYIGISIPTYTNNAAILTAPILNTLINVSNGFNRGIQIGANPDFRITCFKRTCPISKKGLGNYIYHRTKLLSYPAWSDANISTSLLDHKFTPDNNNIQNLKIYLDNNQNNDNLLIFVNGYRMNLSLTSDYAPSEHKVRCGDFNKDDGGYWGSLASQFINKIQTYNTYYADGHDNITTSNHNDNGNIFLSKMKFARSALSSYCAAGKFSAAKNSLPSIIGDELFYIALNEFLCGTNCTFNSNCVNLNTTPNYIGFGDRQFNGFLNGVDLVEKIEQGKIKVKKDANGKVIGKIDIVAHSMGFAYAYGISRAIIDSDIFADGYKLGNFYVLAPENACAAVGIDLTKYESVWQYGTAENGPNPHLTWQRDGVAPQCAIPGLDWNQSPYGRVRFQGQADFVNSHIGGNYGWVVKLTQEGSVKTR